MTNEDQTRDRFERFYRNRLHSDALFRYASKLTGSDDEAMDLLQEALGKGWKWFLRNPDKTDHDMCLVMFTIIRQTRFDHLRSKRRRPILVPAAEVGTAAAPYLIENVAAEEPLPDELVNQPDLASKVRTAIERVANPTFRKLLALYYLSGVEPTLTQVAEELGINPNSVNTYHRRALQALKRSLLTIAQEMNIKTKEA